MRFTGPGFSRPVLATWNPAAWNPAAWTRGSWWRVKCSPAAAELAVSGQAALSAEAPAEHTPPADEPCPLAAGGPCPRLLPDLLRLLPGWPLIAACQGVPGNDPGCRSARARHRLLNLTLG